MIIFDEAELKRTMGCFRPYAEPAMFFSLNDQKIKMSLHGINWIQMKWLSPAAAIG